MSSEKFNWADDFENEILSVEDDKDLIRLLSVKETSVKEDKVTSGVQTKKELKKVKAVCAQFSTDKSLIPSKELKGYIMDIYIYKRSPIQDVSFQEFKRTIFGKLSDTYKQFVAVLYSFHPIDVSTALKAMDLKVLKYATKINKCKESKLLVLKDALMDLSLPDTKLQLYTTRVLKDLNDDSENNRYKSKVWKYYNELYLFINQSIIKITDEIRSPKYTDLISAPASKVCPITKKTMTLEETKFKFQWTMIGLALQLLLENKSANIYLQPDDVTAEQKYNRALKNVATSHLMFSIYKILNEFNVPYCFWSYIIHSVVDSYGNIQQVKQVAKIKSLYLNPINYSINGYRAHEKSVNNLKLRFKEITGRRCPDIDT